MADTYTCATCNGTFEKTRSDEESVREAELLWGPIPEEDRIVICETCYQRGIERALKAHRAKTGEKVH